VTTTWKMDLIYLTFLDELRKLISGLEIECISETAENFDIQC
jgi:hypothetical protein